MPPRKKNTHLSLPQGFCPGHRHHPHCRCGLYGVCRQCHYQVQPLAAFHQRFSQKLPDNWGKVVSFTWKEVQISGASGALNGWVFIRGAGLPGIIITHGLGNSRADMMDLGYRLWERGYNVLVYDLRAHGESTNLVTTLGASEKKDLAAAVEFFKTFRIPSPKGGEVQLIDPNKIGLYGVNVGAYASLMVGGENDSVKAVVADMPYDSVREFAHLRARELFGLDNFITNGLLDIGLQINQGGFTTPAPFGARLPTIRARARAWRL